MFLNGKFPWSGTGGGGSTAWADITGKPSSFTPSAHTHVKADITDLSAGFVYTDAVFVSKNIVASGDGSAGNPFKTIQEAVDHFGYPVDAADYQRRCAIFVLDAGTYTENLTIPHRNIAIYGSGVKISGNITREIDDNVEFGVSSSVMRARFSLIGSGRTARDSHTGFINGIQVTGNYSEVIRSGGVGNTTHDLYFENVRLDGTISYTGSVGQSVTYFQGCRIVGQVTGTGILFLQRATDTRFDSSFAAVAFVSLENCQFNGTALSTAGFTTEQGLRDVQFAAGTTFTVNSAGQTVSVNDVTAKQIAANVTWATNTPTVSRIDDQTSTSFSMTNVLWCVSGGSYATLQAAVDAASDKQTILVGSKGSSWGDVILPAQKRINIIGLQPERALSIECNSITFSPTAGLNININQHFVQNLYVNQTTAGSSAVTFGGTNVGRLRLSGCYINASSGTATLISVTNSAATSSMYIDDCNMDAGSSGTRTALTISNTVYLRIRRTDISGGTKCISQSNGTIDAADVNFECNQVNEVMALSGGTCYIGTSVIKNTTANGSGVLMSGTAILSMGQSGFAINAGTGYCLRGIGTVLYDRVTFSDSAALGQNIKFQSSLTLLTYTTSPSVVA